MTIFRSLSPGLFSLAGLLPVLATSLQAAIIAPTINWEADLDDPGDNLWESSVNSASAAPWIFAGPTSPIDVSAATAGTDFLSIQSAYAFPAAAATRSDWGTPADIPGGGGASGIDATFEMVFRLGDGAGDHLLFETGGGNMGTSISVSGTTLTYRSQQGTGAGQFAAVSLSNLAVGAFHQIVATIDMNADVIQEIQLFHNGALVGTDGPADDGSDSLWDGSDDAGLGRLNGSVTTGTYSNFDGDIAILRYYRDDVFDAASAQQNFEALAIPEPSASLLAALGLLALTGRRRRA